MKDQYLRTGILLGPEAMERLRHCHVAVFGVGGVGGYAVEALARSGVGRLDLIDDDRVAETNLNRQIIALRSTLGQYKVDAFRNRVRDIDPDIEVTAFPVFYLPEIADRFDLSRYDLVIDAVDTVTAKIDLIVRCREAGVPILSALGCGNRFDPTRLVVTDIYKTHTDPLAKVLRTELRKRGIPGLTVVYSEEPPILPAQELLKALEAEKAASGRRSIPGSTAFVPSAAGLILASEAVRLLTDFDPARDGRLRGGHQ
ncbi:MAG: tRNA threonylcarbamoyladenosine dehydratase [Mogibacterium sp.]|nr:tRNA threonylcarbamoyladenosine dehydratase [Mogibacterium sp.]